MIIVLTFLKVVGIKKLGSLEFSFSLTETVNEANEFEYKIKTTSVEFMVFSASGFSVCVFSCVSSPRPSMKHGSYESKIIHFKVSASSVAGG